jgi:uncharacterized membrane protein
MTIKRDSLLNAALIVASFALTAALYSRLPAMVPTHWNARGQADGFTAKPLGAFLMPMVMLGTYLVLSVIPRISPRGFRVERFQRVFEILRSAILAFLFLINVLTLLAGVGVPVPMDRAIFGGVGLLFVVIGNFMGKLTRNFFVGIRTPWTLASEEVWLRTHRLGGKLMVIAGVLIAVSGLFGGGVIPLLVGVGLAAVVPIVYSYVIYRRIEGHGPNDTPA